MVYRKPLWRVDTSLPRLSRAKEVSGLMSTNIEKFKIEEKVRLSLLKHRGDVIEAHADTGCPLEYIIKIHEKMKKKLGREPSLLVSYNITTEILAGRQQRIRYIIGMLRSLEGRDQMELSVCCGKKAYTAVREQKKVLLCIRCNEPTRLELRDREEIFDKKLELVRELRAEEDKLVDWLVKMGYTNAQQPQAPSTVIRNTQLIVGDTSKLTATEKQALVDLNELSPQDAEKVVKQLESVIFNAKYRDANGNFVDPSMKGEDGKFGTATPEAPTS